MSEATLKKALDRIDIMKAGEKMDRLIERFVFGKQTWMLPGFREGECGTLIIEARNIQEFREMERNVPGSEHGQWDREEYTRFMSMRRYPCHLKTWKEFAKTVKWTVTESDYAAYADPIPCYSQYDSDAVKVLDRMSDVDDPWALFEPNLWNSKLDDRGWVCELGSICGNITTAEGPTIALAICRMALKSAFIHRAMQRSEKAS